MATQFLSFLGPGVVCAWLAHGVVTWSFFTRGLPTQDLLPSRILFLELGGGKQKDALRGNECFGRRMDDLSP